MLDKQTVLIVEDDRVTLKTYIDHFKRAGWDVVDAEDLESAQRKLIDAEDREQAERKLAEARDEEGGAAPVHVALLDHELRGKETGLDVAHWLKERYLNCVKTFLVTAHTEPGMIQGGIDKTIDDYARKPVPTEDLLKRSLILYRFACESQKLADMTRKRDAAVRKGFPSIGKSGKPGIYDEETRKTFYGIKEYIAPSLMPVLVLGETGSGKESCADFIHENSGLPSGNYKAVNCAAIAPGLMESELFGHVKGAFTDARNHKLGWIMAAAGLQSSMDDDDEKNANLSYAQWIQNLSTGPKGKGPLPVLVEKSYYQIGEKGRIDGTLFLDEIADLTKAAQAALLRFLESGEVQPVGHSGPPFRVHVRVIAATNRFLGSRPTGNKDDPESFRSDLYWRLAGWTVFLPSLKDRPIEAFEASQQRVKDRNKDWSKDPDDGGLEGLSPDARLELDRMVKKGKFSGPHEGNFRALNWTIDRAYRHARFVDPKARWIDVESLRFAAKEIVELQGSPSDVNLKLLELYRELNRAANVLPDGAHEWGQADADLDADLVNALKKRLGIDKQKNSNFHVWLERPHLAISADEENQRPERWSYLLFVATVATLANNASLTWKDAATLYNEHHQAEKGFHKKLPIFLKPFGIIYKIPEKGDNSGGAFNEFVSWLRKGGDPPSFVKLDSDPRPWAMVKHLGALLKSVCNDT